MPPVKVRSDTALCDECLGKERAYGQRPYNLLDLTVLIMYGIILHRVGLSEYLAYEGIARQRTNKLH